MWKSTQGCSEMMKLKTRLVWLLGSLLAVPGWVACAAAQDGRPNILWITIEDWSADLSCYGTAGIATPHVDALAAEGIRYSRAFPTNTLTSLL